MKFYSWVMTTTTLYKNGGTRTKVLDSGALTREEMIEHLIQILHEAGYHCCGGEGDNGEFDPSEWDRKMSLK